MSAVKVVFFLGADISMTHAGLVGVDYGGEAIFHESIELGKVKGKAHPPILKVRQLYLKLKSNLNHCVKHVGLPTWCAVEQPAYKARHMAYHLGMSTGCFSVELYRRLISHFYVNPVTLKRFVTGEPMAEKSQVSAALKSVGGYSFLDSDSKHCDLTDAAGLALMARCWYLVYSGVPAAWLHGNSPSTAIQKKAAGEFPSHARECFESRRRSGAKRMGLIYRPECFADFERGIFFGVSAQR